MGDFLAFIGLLGFFAGLVMLIYNFIKKKVKKTAVIITVVSFFLFITGAAISGPSEKASPPSEPPVTAVGQQESEQIESDEKEIAEDQSSEKTEGASQGLSEKDKPVATTPGATAPASTTTVTGQMKVHFIDVGQGDAILVQTPTQNILIDGGDRGNTVVNYLRNLGVNSLDVVIGTHPHADHIGGLINVMQSIPVKEVIDPGVVHTTKTFEDYLTLIDEKNIIFTEGRAGMSRDLGGGAKMEILHPVSPSSRHLNDASIVVKITFGEVSFMLTGDAEQAAENQIRSRGYDLNSTVLKVGHHGSRTSTITAFLNAVKPEVAVIMSGKNNTYGHPHQETLAKLTEAGVKTYRTDLHGTIVITTDGQTYDINQKQPYQYTPPKVPEPATSSPTPTPTTPTTTPTPAPENKLSVISYTETVPQGGTASITVQGKPNTQYSITVTYKSGPSKASGLETKTSGSDGKVSWTWKVGANTTPGSWPIDINGGGESVRVNFTVQ
ncbi:MAG: MBL fold metallo-hydrolase [Dethiobacter sp.]|jgi:competence protein ComEC|nr:MBL fold metallo-hydrolase [Dethiobacter sp.]